MKDNVKIKEQLLINEPEPLRLRVVKLEKPDTERKRTAEALREQTHNLGKRVKVLNCLYGISGLVYEQGISLEQTLQGIVAFIPSAWQYPEVTCARIILESEQFSMSNFKETIWQQASGIVVHGDRIGTMEVCYLAEKPVMDEGPFLEEERELINAIAKRLGDTMERKRAKEAL